MKTSLVLLSLLPIVAFAAVLPKAAQTPDEVAKEVIEDVDKFIPGVNNHTLNALIDLSTQTEKRVAVAKKELDALQKEDMSKFEETKKKVKASYDAAQNDIDKAITLASTTVKTGKPLVDNEIATLKAHATQYGELKDKVNQALDSAHEILIKRLSVQSDIDHNTEYFQQIYEYYEAALTWIPNPPPQSQYAEVIQILEGGLDQLVKTMKDDAEHFRSVTQPHADEHQINDMIKLTITGHA